MEKYSAPEIEVLGMTASEVISTSVTYDENESKEDTFYSV